MSAKDPKAMKGSDVSLDQFVEYVKKKDKVLCDKAAEAKLDIVPIVKRVKEDIVADLSILSGVVKAAAEIRAALEMALAKEVPCYFLGMKDRPGLNIPASVVLLKVAGDGAAKGTKTTLFEATSFDPSFEKPDGSKVRLPDMGKVTFKLKENTKYDSFEIVQLVNYDPVPTEKMATLLAGVISDPRKFTEDDKYKPIVLLGNIRGIFPVNILGKNEDDEWKVTGEHPVMVSNLLEEDPVMTPVFKIGLEPIHGITVRVTFDPRKYTTPIVEVADMQDCIDTAFRDIKSPKDQAIALGEIMAGRDILVVGAITKVSSNKSGATYMEVSAYSILDAPQKNDWFGSGVSEESAPATTPPAASAAPPAAEKKAAKKTAAKEKPAEEPAAESAVKPVVKFDEVKASIIEYCEKLQMKPAQLTVEMVKEQICPSAKEGTISAALDEIINP